MTREIPSKGCGPFRSDENFNDLVMNLQLIKSLANIKDLIFGKNFALKFTSIGFIFLM